MKEYEVRVPVAGYISKIVEAENEQDALEKFHNELGEKGVTSSDEFIWDTYDHICKGNVFYAELNEVEITEI